MERAISYLNVMPDTKAGIQFFVDKVLSEVEIRQALPLLVKLTAMEKIIEGVKDGLKDQLLEEASLEGAKSFTQNGVRFDKRSKTTYYYNHCAKHEQLKAQLKSLEEMMKVAQSEFADVETGEIIQPARSSVSDYIAVTLSK